MPTFDQPITDVLMDGVKGPPSGSPECISNIQNLEGEILEVRSTISSSILGKLRRFDAWMEKKTNLESQGVERETSTEQQRPPTIDIMLIWFSVILNPEYLGVGLLGPILGVSVGDSIICVAISTILGSMLPAFAGIQCPSTGLRQIVIARYSFGFWGSKVCSVFNIITNLGWGVIACILAGDMLRAVSGEVLDVSIGILIVLILALVVCFLGYGFIHHWQRYAWILVFVLMVVQLAQAARYLPSNSEQSPLTGRNYHGACLTFVAITLGTITPWCSIVGDYYIHYPMDLDRKLTFSLTWLGIALPTMFVNALGVLIGGIIVSNDSLLQTYSDGGIGSVVLATMWPTIFARFVGVTYALSLLSTLIVAIYSSTLSIQLLSRRLQRMPRCICTIGVAMVCLALALGGRNRLHSILSNFLPFLAYWSIAFGLILAMENFIFREALGGYNADYWDDTQRLPLGIAGTAALLSSFALSFLGMNQTWYTSPLAAQIATHGGDVGNYVVICVVLLVYVPLRAYEIKYLRRA